MKQRTLWLVGFLAASLVAPAAGAQPKRKAPSGLQIAGGHATPPRRAPVRRNIEVSWGNSWWPAEVLETRSGFTKIHYTGWGPEWDEWVEASRIRAATVALTSARAGQRVEIEWHGSFWPGEVIAERAGLYKVHYTGFGPEWDEWVESNRLRSSASSARQSVAPRLTDR